MACPPGRPRCTSPIPRKCHGSVTPEVEADSERRGDVRANRVYFGAIRAPLEVFCTWIGSRYSHSGRSPWGVLTYLPVGLQGSAAGGPGDAAAGGEGAEGGW